MTPNRRDHKTDTAPPPLTLIDGYNLIHALGVGGRMPGHGGLERARAALLARLAELLPGEEAARTVVVFDAARPPPGRPRTLVVRGIRVHFAADHEDADALLEELIARHSTPRKLTVVSSDHRLQRAARRRKARALDSEAWYDEQLRKRQDRGQVLVPSNRPAEPEEDETEFWLRQFADALDDEPAPPAAPHRAAPHRGAPRKARPPGKPSTPPSATPVRKKSQPDELIDPFPPGYGDDVWEEEQRDRGEGSGKE